MGYRVKGKKNGKPYLSKKTFRTTESAMKYGYTLVYNPSGNTKRKNQLYSMTIVKE